MMVKAEVVFAFNLRHDLALCVELHVESAAGQGPCPLAWYICMNSYTDQ